MRLLKFFAVMMFLQCFIYKRTDLVPTLELGVTVTPDRIMFVVIVVATLLYMSRGELEAHPVGKLELCMLVFAVVCTASAFLTGLGAVVLYYLYDFIYNPFLTFLIVRSIPHSPKKLETIMLGFLPLGAYLAINGVFERFGPHALVWPKYILDPHIGTQFERVRGSFASAEALGLALIIMFLFYALYVTFFRETRDVRWAYPILFVIPGVIYTTNQRSAWLAFAVCLALVVIAKTPLRRVAKLYIAAVIILFLSGAATGLSAWRSQTLFSKRQETVDYRLVNNMTTLAMGTANPLFGIGFGNFRIMWPVYFQQVEGAEIADLTDGNHNTFLGLFAEVGLAGLIPYLLIVYYMLRTAVRVYRKSEDGFERTFALVFLVAVVCYVIGANFSDYRSGPFGNTAIFLLFGAVAGLDAYRKRLPEPPKQPPLQRARVKAGTPRT